MGVRSQTPRKPCPFCGCADIYAGTILTWDNVFGDMVLGTVRCNWCDVKFTNSWSPKYGEEYDRKRLEKMVADWNKRDGKDGKEGKQNGKE